MSKQAYRIAHKTQAIKTPNQDKARLRQNQAAYNQCLRHWRKPQ